LRLHDCRFQRRDIRRHPLAARLASSPATNASPAPVVSTLTTGLAEMGKLLLKSGEHPGFALSDQQ
jgi:hypothetical protein